MRVNPSESVAVQDTTANRTFRDAIGNKADASSETLNGTQSLFTVVKSIFGRTTKPTADLTNNDTFAQVIGSKDDAAQTTVGTTRSLMAYVKGLLNRTAAPTADTTNNGAVNEVVGNKSDAAQTTVGTTRSVMAYVKGILGRFAWTTDQDTSPTLANNTTEQDVITGGTSTPGDLVVWGLNLSNLAVGTTIRVYMKLDAANYTEVEALRQTVTAGKSAAGFFRFTCTGGSAATGYKVTLQAGSNPGATQIYAHARRRAA